MDSQGFFLLLGIGLTIVFALMYFHHAAVHFVDKGKEKQAHERSRFIMHNDVEGTLYVDEHAIDTYINGYIVLDNKVGVDFYNSPSLKIIEIMDITFMDKSLFSYAEKGDSYREKADYAIRTLKELASQGKITRELASEVEEIVLKVDDLQEHLKQGKIYQLPGSGDYAWKF